MNKFKKLFSKYRIDGYIVPKNDEYFNEYIPAYKDRLKFISNFSGSAGFAILFKKKIIYSLTEDIQLKHVSNQVKNLR